MFIFLFVQIAAGLPIFYFLASLFANLFLAKFFLCRLFLDTLLLFVIELILIFPLHRLVWGQLFFRKLDWCFYQVGKISSVASKGCDLRKIPLKEFGSVK